MQAWRRLLILVALCWAGGVRSQPVSGMSEAAVKAAFLLNFTNFVEWPANAFGAPGEPVVIAVIGDDEVYAELERLAIGRRAAGRPFALLRLREATAQGRVHLAYIGPRRDARLTETISASEGPVLVVTQAPGALEMGAVINFLTQDRRVRFEASVAEAQARGLRLSARLLGVAVAVDGRPQ
ncbi:MAG TPA: YfiR family protein [Ramlibacter sp.]|nr:YfiR family protein [Ramlibacter sp.]